MHTYHFPRHSFIWMYRGLNNVDQGYIRFYDLLAQCTPVETYVREVMGRVVHANHPEVPNPHPCIDEMRVFTVGKSIGVVFDADWHVEMSKPLVRQLLSVREQPKNWPKELPYVQSQWINFCNAINYSVRYKRQDDYYMCRSISELGDRSWSRCTELLEHLGLPNPYNTAAAVKIRAQWADIARTLNRHQLSSDSVISLVEKHVKAPVSV